MRRPGPPRQGRSATPSERPLALIAALLVCASCGSDLIEGVPGFGSDTVADASLSDGSGDTPPGEDGGASVDVPLPDLADSNSLSDTAADGDAAPTDVAVVNEDGSEVDEDTADLVDVDSSPGDTSVLDGSVLDGAVLDGAVLDGGVADVGSFDVASADSGDTTSSQCDDENDCTIDYFEDGVCKNTYAFGICCTANPMCDDGDACTEDLCADEKCVHIERCCESDVDCADGDGACTSERCVGGICSVLATGAQGCCNAAIWSASFDDGTLGGLTLFNAYLDVGWHLAEETEATSPPGALRYGIPFSPGYDTGIEHSGTASLPPLPLPAGVRVTLRFDLFLDVEVNTFYDILKVELIDATTGQELKLWEKSQAPLYYDWFPVEIDVSAFGGKVVVLRLRFDTVDVQFNEGTGIFVDNLRLEADCAPLTCQVSGDCDDGWPYSDELCLTVPGDASGSCTYVQSSTFCTSSSECDDAKPCTVNVCSGSECVYLPQANCCLADSECDDGNPCTTDDCSGLGGAFGGQCIYPLKFDCCLSAASCDDNNPCTADSCPGAGLPCTHELLPGCCGANADCDDGNACTTDLCGSGDCIHEPLCCSSDLGCDDEDPCTLDVCDDGQCDHLLEPVAACCLISPFAADFTGGNTNGFQVALDSNAADNVTWHPTTEQGISLFGALHAGAPVGTYDTGERVVIVARSGSLFVPVTAASELSFWIFLGNEWAYGLGSIGWDRFDLYLDFVDGADPPELLWTSASGSPVWWKEDVVTGQPTGPTWTQVRDIDLAAYRGRSVRLELRFDSIDEEQNAFEGVYIDDLFVFSTCD